MNRPVIRRMVSASPLAPFIDCFWIHCGYRQPHSCEQVLPTATADVIFAVDCAGRARSSIAGPRTTFVDLDNVATVQRYRNSFQAGRRLAILQRAVQ